MVKINEVFEIEDVSAEPLDVPSQSMEICERR